MWSASMPNRRPNTNARSLKVCARILLLLMCIPTAMTYALPNDRDQPIHITADKAVRDEKKGITVYSGNVQMSQGSMELEADTLTIHHPSDEPEIFVAEGNPAKMRQQPEIDKAVVHAHAGTIEYFKLEDRVHLRTDARIEQDGAVVNGDTIDYFIAKELIQAESDSNNAGDKVVVVIPPNVQKKEEATQPPPAEAEKRAPIEPSPANEDSSQSIAEQEPLQASAEEPAPIEPSPANEDSSQSVAEQEPL
jgi:lipopolysaccharide export system protein LptA